MKIVHGRITRVNPAGTIFFVTDSGKHLGFDFTPAPGKAYVEPRVGQNIMAEIDSDDDTQVLRAVYFWNH